MKKSYFFVDFFMKISYNLIVLKKSTRRKEMINMKKTQIRKGYLVEVFNDKGELDSDNEIMYDLEKAKELYEIEKFYARKGDEIRLEVVYVDDEDNMEFDLDLEDCILSTIKQNLAF